MTKREYEAFKKDVDASRNRCACCRKPVYECPAWIANNTTDDPEPKPGA